MSVRERSGSTLDPKRYRQLVQERAPKPNVVRDATRAFLLGGCIALIGQFVFDYFRLIEPTRGEAVAATLATMIFFGAVLTAFGVYDKLGEWGGAGAAIPITGFANSMVSSAMDFRRDGIITGLTSKLFVIAGPVIVFAVVVGFIVGLLRSAFLGLFA